MKKKITIKLELIIDKSKFISDYAINYIINLKSSGSEPSFLITYILLLLAPHHIVSSMPLRATCG